MTPDDKNLMLLLAKMILRNNGVKLVEGEDRILRSHIDRIEAEEERTSILDRQFRERVKAQVPPLSVFGMRIKDALSLLTDDWQVIESEGVHPLDKICIIVTPGLDLPEEIREGFRQMARDFVPIGYRVTFEFLSALP